MGLTRRLKTDIFRLNRENVFFPCFSTPRWNSSILKENCFTFSLTFNNNFYSVEKKYQSQKIIHKVLRKLIMVSKLKRSSPICGILNSLLMNLDSEMCKWSLIFYKMPYFDAFTIIFCGTNGLSIWYFEYCMKTLKTYFRNIRVADEYLKIHSEN